jgi:predicted membrane metal-binding protein
MENYGCEKSVFLPHQVKRPIRMRPPATPTENAIGHKGASMKYFERRTGLHLLVLTIVVLAVVAAFIVEGLGFALIVALACVIVLSIGYPLLVILAEEHDLPIARRRS